MESLRIKKKLQIKNLVEKQSALDGLMSRLDIGKNRISGLDGLLIKSPQTGNIKKNNNKKDVTEYSRT